MILAGSIVGSGELIVTTKLGAEAGFTFLWFVLVSCLVKVVVQTEIARHTISSGETFLCVFNSLPGPSMMRPDWLTLRWMAAVVAACVVGVAIYVNLTDSLQTTSYGLIIGVCVVVLSIAAAWAITSQVTKSQSPSVDDLAKRVVPTPLAEDRLPRTRVNWFMGMWLASMVLVFVNSGAILGGAGQTLQMATPDLFGAGGARVWAFFNRLRGRFTCAQWPVCNTGKDTHRLGFFLHIGNGHLCFDAANHFICNYRKRPVVRSFIFTSRSNDLWSDDDRPGHVRRHRSRFR